MPTIAIAHGNVATSTSNVNQAATAIGIAGTKIRATGNADANVVRRAYVNAAAITSNVNLTATVNKMATGNADRRRERL